MNYSREGVAMVVAVSSHAVQIARQGVLTELDTAIREVWPFLFAQK